VTANIIAILWWSKRKSPGLALLLVLAILAISAIGAKNSFAAIQEPEVVLVAPQSSENTSIMAGKPIFFFVYFTNPFPHPLSIGAYARLKCQIVGKNKRAEVIALPVLPLDTSQEMIPGNGFFHCQVSRGWLYGHKKGKAVPFFQGLPFLCWPFDSKR